MGFGKLFTEELAGSGASSLTGLITGGISQALGLSWSPEKAMREQEATTLKDVKLQYSKEEQAKKLYSKKLSVTPLQKTSH